MCKINSPYNLKDVLYLMIEIFKSLISEKEYVKFIDSIFFKTNFGNINIYS